MEYRGYLIEQDKTGFAPKKCSYHIYSHNGENYCGSGESIEDCKQQIDEILENAD